MGKKEKEKEKGKAKEAPSAPSLSPQKAAGQVQGAQGKGKASRSKVKQNKPNPPGVPSAPASGTSEAAPHSKTGASGQESSPAGGKGRGRDWESFLQRQKEKLLELRDHILNQMQGVAQDTLRVSSEGSGSSPFGLHQADAGSEAYDKDFALTLLSQEQDALYEIEEALKRIENGTYGVCQMCGKPIPRARLEAVPYARFTVDCQAIQEREYRARRRWESVPQFMESAESLVEEEGEEGFEEEERRREKE
jgi:DnaK suppressor protein